MRQSKWFRRTAGVALVCASVVSVAPLSGSVTPVVSAQAAADPGGEFHALTPTRILDTRPDSSINSVVVGNSQVSGQSLRTVPNPTIDKSADAHFSPLGMAGLPTDAGDVLAIVANITVTQPGGKGNLAVYPKGFAFGGADGKGSVSSLINFEANTSVPNLAIVGLGVDGALTLDGFTNPGSSYHVIIDVLGFISTSQYDEAGSRLEVVDPARILDTRDTTPIARGTSRELDVRGATARGTNTVVVPDRESVTAVLVNLTLVNKQPGAVRTFVAATPDTYVPGPTTPSSSNVLPNAVKANMAVVPIAADGSISLYNHSGNLHLVVDVLGYFEDGVHTDGNRGRIVPLDAPFRSFDTREPAFGDAQLQHGSEEEWSFSAFVESVVLNPGAENEAEGPAQQGLLGNLTAVNLEPYWTTDVGNTSHLKLTPADANAAETSNVNFGIGQVVPNMSLVKYGTSGGDDHVIKAYNHYGQIDYLLDVYAIVLDDEPA